MPELTDLCSLAVDLGASDAVLVSPAQVVTAEWVRMKCLYGCTPGRCLTCPPNSPTPQDTRRLLEEYRTILLLRFDIQPERTAWLESGTRVLETALKLERELFLRGHYKVFAIAGGRSCDLDEACGTPDTCTHREGLRPGPVGCGIDIFSTSANAGWPLNVVHDRDEPYKRFALVLVE